MARDQAGRWQQGTSGNPSGKPPKERQLTNALIECLNTEFRIIRDKEEIARLPKQQIAKYLVEAAMTGFVTLMTGERITFSADQLQKLWGDLYTRVDGPPAQEIDANLSNSILFDAQETITKDDDADNQLERPVPTDGEAEGSPSSDTE